MKYLNLDKFKNFYSKALIVPIPDELKEQYDKYQLKNSLQRLKILAVVLLSFETVSMLPSMLTGGSHINITGLSHILSLFGGAFHFSLIFLIYFLFFGLASFPKLKDRRIFLWSLCCFFIVFRYISALMTIWFTESNDVIIYVFSATVFFNLFVADFKPLMFTVLSWAFAILTILILVIQYSNFSDMSFMILSMFIAIFIIRILYYNSNSRSFISIANINALNEKLASLSITDELTKLNNRRSFFEYMDIIWKQSHRLSLPITVIMIDIDYFKKYNDSLGHLEGDNALIAVAQCLKNNLKRETDFVARFGGEEFVCLLPYIEKAKAMDFANKLVKNIENMKLPHPMSEVSKYVTISAGMSSIVPPDNNTYKQLLDKADKALYTAKQNGRNRVITN